MYSMEVDATEVIEKMEQVQRDLAGNPMVQAVKDSTMMVTGTAKRYTPVDTGRLRASITPSIAVRDKVVRGVVGSNVTYAPYQELGTRPFWPPLSALETWARRHGTTAFVVARAISRRGIKAVKYLQRALQHNRWHIISKIENAVKRITDA